MWLVRLDFIMSQVFNTIVDSDFQVLIRKIASKHYQGVAKLWICIYNNNIEENNWNPFLFKISN